MTNTPLRNISKYTSRGISPKYVDVDGLLVLNQKCIRDQKIRVEQARLTDKNKQFSLDKKLKKFDILINSTGVGTLGRVAQLKYDLDATVDSHVTIFRVADIAEELEENIDPLYIGYSVRNQEKYMESLGAGATGQTELSKNSILDNVRIWIPKYTIQTRIASIISAYDGLIENNEKRIKTLEEMAQLLYTEWFVKLKFPGHEKVKMIDSCAEYSMIPERWEVKSVGDFSELVSRGPSLNYIEEGGVPVVNQRCVRNGLIKWESVQYARTLTERNKNMYLRVYDCLINSMGVGTLGRVSRNVNIHQKAIIHNCITLVRSKRPDIESAFLYYFLKSKEKYFVSSGVGATGQTSLKPEIAANLKILIPQYLLLENFSDKVMPMWDEVGLLLQNQDVLQKTRDLLIPQLVTGKRELN